MVDTLAALMVANVVIAILVLMAVMAARYKKVPPDKVMVVFGRRMTHHRGPQYKVIAGGGKFIVPVVEDVEFLDLRLRRSFLELDNIRTEPAEGSVPVRMTISVLYKVSSEESALCAASELIMGRTDAEVKRMVDVIVEGSLREVAATRTPRELDMDRREYTIEMAMRAQKDLVNLGIEIRSYHVIRVIHKGVDRVG